MNALQDQVLLQRAALCLQGGNLAEAKAICEKILARNKKHVHALAMLAQAEMQSGEIETGLALFQRCAALQPKSIDVQLMLAQAFARSGKYAQAIQTFQKVLRAAPGNAEALRGIATAYERSGDDHAAAALLKPIFDAGTEDAALAVVQATLDLKFKRPQQAVDVLNKHLANAHASPRFYFTLGKAYEQLREFDRAFEAYTQGNLAEPRRFDLQAQRDFTASMLRTFSADAIKKLPRARHGSRLPVITTGRPRSGTTLVGRIIAAHPQAHEAGELIYLSSLTVRLSLEIGSARIFPESAADMDQHDVDRLGAEYVAYLKKLGGSAARVVDKNLGNVSQMGFVNMLVPEAAAILCDRDPLDCCFSIFAERFSALHTYAANLYDIGVTHHLTELLRQHWLHVLDMPVMEVRYEDLIADQETVSRKIIEFCGLPWNDQCLKYYENKTNSRASAAAQTLSYDQVRQPIYTTSVGRAANFARHLAPLHEGLAHGDALARDLAAELHLDWYQPGDLPTAQNLSSSA